MKLHEDSLGLKFFSTHKTLVTTYGKSDHNLTLPITHHKSVYEDRTICYFRIRNAIEDSLKVPDHFLTYLEHSFRDT